MITKLFIITHKNNIYIPNSSVLISINPDNAEKDNIAEKLDYSELRAHYFVWRNESLETQMVGLFQFRRYLDLTASYFTDFNINKRPVPYQIKKYPMAIHYSEIALRNLDNYDVIAPIREYTGIPVWQRYSMAHGHRISDLRLIYKVISEKYPEYMHAADLYLNGTGEYYGNLYIMRREIYNDYCTWLFSILNEYDRQASDIPPRTQGYLAERIFGIWFTNAVLMKKLRCAEVPRIHFWGYDDEKHKLRYDKLINFFLPPGSERRAWVRKFKK